MKMSFKKQLIQKEELETDITPLLCSEPSCSKIWTVRMEGSRPYCSFHQWGDKSPITLLPEKISEVPKDAWWAKDEL